jgi:hypothetical protein
MNQKNEPPIVIYEGANKAVEVRLDTDQETIWLTQAQMAELFDVKPQNITMHLKNVFDEGELAEEATCKDFLQVQREGGREVKRKRKHYSLDAVISVGYRVSSARATRFRVWATRTLREHLTRGWTLNRQRFEENARELEAALALVRRAARSPALDTDSGRGLVDIVSRYAQTFLLLQRYDEGLLTDPQAQSGGKLPSIGAGAQRAGWPENRADGTGRGHRAVRPRPGRWPGVAAGQSGPERVRGAGLPQRGSQGRAFVVLRHQESSVLGRQKTQRSLSIRGFPAP